MISARIDDFKVVVDTIPDDRGIYHGVIYKKETPYESCNTYVGVYRDSDFNAKKLYEDLKNLVDLWTNFVWK